VRKTPEATPAEPPSGSPLRPVGRPLAILLACIAAAGPVRAAGSPAAAPPGLTLDMPQELFPSRLQASFAFRCGAARPEIRWNRSQGGDAIVGRADAGRPEIDLLAALRAFGADRPILVGAGYGCRGITAQGDFILLARGLVAPLAAVPEVALDGGLVAHRLHAAGDRIVDATPGTLGDVRSAPLHNGVPDEAVPDGVEAGFRAICAFGASGDRTASFSWSQTADRRPRFAFAAGDEALSDAEVLRIAGLFGDGDRVVGADIGCLQTTPPAFRLDIHYRCLEPRVEINPHWTYDTDPVSPETVQAGYHVNRVYSLVIMDGRVVRALAAGRSQR